MDTIRIGGADHLLVGVLDETDGTNPKTLEIASAVAYEAGDGVDVVYPGGELSSRRGAADYWLGGAATPPSPPPSSGTISVRVAASSDDAEQRLNDDSIGLTSTDLEMTWDVQYARWHIVGMRFLGVQIPQGATIESATVQFQVDEPTSGAVSLTIRGQDIDTAPTFTSATDNIGARVVTSASVAWSPTDWLTVGEAGADQETPDIKTVIQEIVNRAGWSPGNDLVIVVTGDGADTDTRIAEAWDGVSAAAPLLRVTYSTGNATPVLDPIGSRVGTEGAGMTIVVTASDPDGVPILSADLSGLPAGHNAVFSGGDFTWTPQVGDSPGPYTVTFTATDDTDPQLTDSEAVQIDVLSGGVNDPPVLAAIGPQVAQESIQLLFGVSASDDSGYPLLSADLSALSGSPSFVDYNNGTGVLSWTPGTTDAPGPYVVRITATDPLDSGLADFEDVSISVLEESTGTVHEVLGVGLSLTVP